MSGDHNANQDYDKKINAAAEHLGSGALKMIKTILMKHDAAIMEASQEAIEAAVSAERERLYKKFMDMHESQKHRNNYWHFAAHKILEEIDNV